MGRLFGRGAAPFLCCLRFLPYNGAKERLMRRLSLWVVSVALLATWTVGCAHQPHGTSDHGHGSHPGHVPRSTY
jgi:hypothetical protein